MVHIAASDNKKTVQKKPEHLYRVMIVLLYSLFFIVFGLPLNADSNSFKSRLQQSFINYNKSIFTNYTSIEFIDSTEYKKTINGICETHYEKTALYTIDLIKKRVNSRIINFHLICGKNEKHRFAGMETQTSLKNLYLFSDYMNKQWNQLLIHQEESYISFKASEWFIPLSINLHYDSNNYFPAKILILSDDHKIDVSMEHSKHFGIYLMDELMSDISFNFILVNHRIETRITRSQYIVK